MKSAHIDRWRLKITQSPWVKRKILLQSVCLPEGICCTFHGMGGKNQLRLFDLTMIVITLVIGMGIFRTPVNVAAASPDAPTFYLAWALGGMVAFCGALTYAEIGSRLPVRGGYYKIFSIAYHPAVAFAVNCIILVSNAASLAMVALVGGEYLTGILMPLPGGDVQGPNLFGSLPVEQAQTGIAICAVLLFYLINLMGLKMSASTQNVLGLIKIGLILLLISPLFFAESAADTLPAPVSESMPLSGYLKALGTGLVAVSFTYGGYQQSINFGGEVLRPARNIPRGIFIGIGVIILLYLSINMAYVKVIGFSQLGQSRNIAAVLAGKIFGPGADKALSLFFFLGVLAYVNVLLMSNPRVMFAMSEDGILPRVFQKTHARTGALTVSLSVFTGICLLIIFWARAFDKILSFSIFLDCIGMVLSAATVFILRKRSGGLQEKEHYRMRFFPLLPLIFIAAYLFIALSITLSYRDNDYAAMTGLVMMGIFGILYFVIRKVGAKSNDSFPPRLR